MINEFKNKNILITGGSSGIGLNIAKYFLNKGANIITISRRKKISLPKSKKMKHISFDLTHFSKYDFLFKKIKKEFGPIDYFIHAAGIHFIKPIRFTTIKDIDQALNINLKSAILISKYFLNKELFNRPCSVLFIASVMGVVGSPGLSIYSATKSALIGFAKSLSAELANQKIRVNCLSPGIVKSPLYNEYSKQLTKEMNDKIIASHPLGLGNFDDINSSVNFLLSNESRWITGHNLVIDGGYSTV
jgi:NAD(P)-dependent dehydrogenase (short-subunit alcohol dehydrogenase family)